MITFVNNQHELHFKCFIIDQITNLNGHAPSAVLSTY